MALQISSYSLPSGLTAANAYALITRFTLLGDRTIELEVSIWKDAEACGNGLPRIGSQVVHVGGENPSYQSLYTAIANAAYSHVQSLINGATDYQGETVFPGDLLPEVSFNP